jgi:hypothetical protein
MPKHYTSYMSHRDGEPPAADDPLLDFAPVPHGSPRKNSIGPERQKKFIAALAACGIVTQAAREIGASTDALYKLRHKAGGEEFSAAWDAAIDRGVARLEDCALQRAIQGEERMVVSAGQLMGYERRHNDSLVMFFLRQRRPERYGTVRAENLKPGHPEYERIRRETRIKLPDIEEVRAEILRKVAAMERARQRKGEPLLAGPEAQEGQTRDGEA